MKMVLIAYYEALEEEVLELLMANGQTEFTQWRKVRGKGKHSEPHLLTPVWPKANSVLMACVPDETAARLLQGVRALRTTHGKAGIKAFSLPVHDVT